MTEIDRMPYAGANSRGHQFLTMAVGLQLRQPGYLLPPKALERLGVDGKADVEQACCRYPVPPIRIEPREAERPDDQKCCDDEDGPNRQDQLIRLAALLA